MRTRLLYGAHTSDPPWPFGDKLPGDGRGAAKKYDLLTIEQIKAFPQPLMLDDSYLFLWRVSSMVEEAYEVVRAWDFVPKTEIVWVKLTKNGKRHMGMGRTLRAQHETCIVATRGRPKVSSKSIRSTFEAPVGRHSEKPARFYEIVRELVPGPYVATFERQQRPGFRSYGNELAEAHP